MAKAKKPAVTATKKADKMGPFLAAALIAEKVIVEGTVPTVIRIVDRLQLPQDQFNNVKNDGNISFPLTFMLVFRSCGFKGTKHISISQVSPSGKEEPTTRHAIEFDGKPDTGRGIRSQVSVKWESQGQYYFDVYMDDKLCTRVPLNIEIVIGIGS